jgi:hypothetical protein
VTGVERRQVFGLPEVAVAVTGHQLTERECQLARCLKPLGTDAPIRAEVQRELAAVRAEQESRASTV